MDPPPRSPPSDSDPPIPAVTRSAVPTTPTKNPFSSRAVTGSSVRSQPADDPEGTRASVVRDNTVAGSTVRSLETNNSLAPRSSAVRDEAAVTGYPGPTSNPLASLGSAVREDAVAGAPVKSPVTNNTLAVRASSVGDEAVTGYPVRSPPHSHPKEKTKVFVPRPPRSWIIGDDTVTGSTVRSPSPSAEKHTSSIKDSTAIVPRTLVAKDESITGSPVRSPSEKPNALPKEARATVTRAAIVSDEAVIGSPVSSPHGEVKQYEKQNSFYSVSSFQSADRDADYPNTSPQHKETVYGSPTRGATTVGSVIQSSLGDVVTEDLSSLEKATSPMIPMANRMVARETTSSSKVGGRGLTGAEEGTIRKPAVTKAVVGLRIVALVLSLISFSIMAADKTSGWDGDSFDRYTEFRYCLSINVLAFVYSLFQVFVQFHHKIKRRRIMSRPVSYCFDFFMDQILAYLSMSASTSAASRNGEWVADFGSDDFTKMMTVSIAMSFLAFFALAFSSIMSAYKFFGWKY